MDNGKIQIVKNICMNFYEVNKNFIEYDEKNIDELIGKSIEFIGQEFDEEERSELKKLVMTQCQIKLDDEGVMIFDNYDHFKWYDENKEDIKEYHWLRYKSYLLDSLGFAPSIINTLEQTTLKDLMNSIGNPKADSHFLRRGLIIGEVQSGKTSTYIGLVCKAVDAGYKVVILLTGTTESLRRQTQQRIEEGFVGADLSTQGGHKETRVGVGKDNQPILVTSLTSRSKDFTGKSDQIIASIASNKTVLFVIKKNTTVLKKMIKWLKDLNADPIDGKVHYPMILIDDEADNASVNTKKDDEEPTAVNKKIRELLDAFTQSSYVGFTATPFANIFINPEYKESMGTQDLFPENFIKCLPTPSNYVGAKRIFCDGGDLQNALIHIDDAGMDVHSGFSFHCKHSKEWRGELPKSLTESIYVFLLVNAIRDLRGDKKKHRSMLINLSRFIMVQEYIKTQVEIIYNEAYTAIKYHLSNDIEKTKKNPVLNQIYNIWLREYSSLEFSWEEIVSVMYESIEPIMIQIVNSGKNTDKLDYENSKEGLRVIAVGGLALSRGLTLEGLAVSYFFRNTATYDVLMQMGRWFGYRQNYEDLFRIWIGAKSAGWYADITKASEELREEMRIMNDSERTPKDFGLKVLNDSAELGITATNKMRTAKDQLIFESYFGNFVQAPYVSVEAKQNDDNIQSMESFIKLKIEEGVPFVRNSVYGNHFVLENMSKESIMSLLKTMQISKQNVRLDLDEVCEFIEGCSDSAIDRWDILFAEGDRGNMSYSLNGNDIACVKRTGECTRNIIRLTSQGQLTGTSDTIHGLNKDQIGIAKRCHDSAYYLEKKKVFKGTYPAKVFFEYIKDRKPLLVFYLVDFVDGSEKKTDETIKIMDEFGKKPLLSLAMGMPRSDYNQSKITKYKANRIYFEDAEEE